MILTSLDGEEWVAPRLPLSHGTPRSHQIYMTRKHPLVVYYKRASKLMMERKSLEIYGSGSCVKGAIMLAQDLHTEFPHLIKKTEVHLGNTNAPARNFEVSTIKVCILI